MSVGTIRLALERTPRKEPCTRIRWREFRSLGPEDGASYSQRAADTVITCRQGAGTTSTNSSDEPGASCIRNWLIDAHPVLQGSKAVFVVDDEDGIRSFVAGALQLAGFETLEAGNGREALELFHVVADRVALAILDIELPTMTGNELLANMRATRPDLRALFISGHPVGRARATVGQLDAIGFLRKPFRIKALMTEVRRLLQAP